MGLSIDFVECIEDVASYLLGGLLLLLLLLLGLSCIFFFGRSSLFYWGWCLFLLLLFLDSNKQTNNILRLDHVVFINLELSKDIINLSLGHLVSPGHESMSEHLGVDLAVSVISLVGLDNEVIRVVALAGHLLLEHADHVVSGAGATDLSQQAIQLALSHQDTNVVKSTTQVIFVNGAVLVDVHELEAVLVHLDLLLGEASLSLILTLAHDEVLVSPCSQENSPC